MALAERLEHARHLVWDVAARRSPLESHDARQALTMRGAAVARAEAASGDTKVAGEGRQTADGARRLPAIGPLVHRAPAQHDHGGLRGRVLAREGYDALRGNPGYLFCPLRRVTAEIRGQLVEALGMLGHEFTVVQFLADDHVHHAEGQRGVRAGPQEECFI